MDLERIQRALRSESIDGWLFYDFRGSDPIGYSVLGLDPNRHSTRRWFYFIPANGTPTKIVHRIEQKALEDLPGNDKVYLPWHELHDTLRDMLFGCTRVAMQYSPDNNIPYLSRVDAGTVDLIRSFGVEVTSSASLLQHAEAILSEKQFESHEQAGEKIHTIIDETVAEIGHRIRSGDPTTEFDVQAFMTHQYARYGLVTDHPPIVAVGSNAADPHYSPHKTSSRALQRNELVLIDTWARLDEPDSIFYDVTWTAYIGKEIPQKIQDVFRLVTRARDRGVAVIQDAWRQGTGITGAEVDDAVRQVIVDAGYGADFIHRTGHSIYTSGHGNGTNLDNLETKDTRQLMPRTCFSIEPGVYLEGEFGIRSEINVYLSENEVKVTGRPPQTELILIDA